MAGKIFINYRRGDDSGNAGRLFDRLQDAFKSEQLFLDVDNIAPGLDFVRVLSDQIADCDVLLAVIGKGWLEARDPTGRRRLDDPEDFVRLEISLALNQGKRVIPVLVGEAQMPRPDELPSDIRPLARRSAVRLTHERFHADTQGLIRALQTSLGETQYLSPIQLEASLAIEEGDRKRAQAPSQTRDEDKAVQMRSRGQATAPKRRLASMLNLASRLEAAAIRAGPILLGFISLTCAFLLILASQLFGFAILKYHINGADKEIGFLSAPNWTIVYAVLFPPYLYLFAVLIERCKFTLTSLLRSGIIVGPTGARIEEAVLWNAWQKNLRKLSVLLWWMLIIVVVQATSEWITTCLRPLLQGHIGSRPVGWATLGIVQSDAPSLITSVAFSFVAYLYMAVALFIYLSILVYGVAFCLFLNALADPSGSFRLVLRDSAVGNRLSDIGINIYACSVLGLCAGFMMRLQAVYLGSNHTKVTDLLFSDLLSLSGQFQTIPGLPRYVPFSMPSEWTGLLQIMFTLLTLFAAVYLLHDTFEKARQYYLDNVDDNEWRTMMRLPYNRNEVDNIRARSFLATVFPGHIHFVVIVAGIVMSALFIGYGSIVIATILYAVVVLGLFPTLRGSKVQGKPN